MTFEQRLAEIRERINNADEWASSSDDWKMISDDLPWATENLGEAVEFAKRIVKLYGATKLLALAPLERDARAFLAKLDAREEKDGSLPTIPEEADG